MLRMLTMVSGRCARACPSTSRWARTICTSSNGGASGEFAFHPTGTGTTTLSLATPSGYSTPTNLNQSITATVGIPGITFNQVNYAMGKDSVEDTFSVVLGAPAPAGGVTVTVTSLDPTRLLIAPNSSSAVGAASLQIPVTAGQTVANYSMQSLADNGTV